jgi:membrane protease YdiL (CAAX protease family)
VSGSPPDVVPPDPVDPAAGSVPRWGLGDVLAGIALANLLLVVSQVVAYSIGGWTEMAQVPLWAVALLQIPMWVGWIIVVVWAARTKGNGVVADFGLRARWPDLPVGVALGLVVQLAVLPAIYWPILRLIGQTNEDLARPAQALADKAQGAFGWVVLTLVVVVGAPIVEELFYRGLLLQALRKRGLGDAVACVICGAVFAAMHLQPLQFIGLFVLGTLLSYLTVRTGRLGPAIATHMVFNAVTVAVLAFS